MRDASRFTKAADGGVVDVTSIDPNNRYARGPYRCLACDHLMVPALGRTRKHHFKHKAGRPLHCVDETYLHQLGKLTLFHALSDAINSQHQFPLFRTQPIVCDYHEAEFGFICTSQPDVLADDLAKRFDTVEMEKGVDGFIADILLTSAKTGENLLLEISVTHRCEQEKISSGLGIVEIQINREEDIKPLKYGIGSSSANVSLYNLPVPEAVPQRCLVPCDVPCTLFLLYDSGKAWYQHSSSREMHELTADPRLVTWEIFNTRTSDSTRSEQNFLDFFKEMLVKQQFQSRHNVRSCMLCQYNGGQISANDIHCDYNNRNVWMSSSACSCPAYLPAEEPEEAMSLLDLNLTVLP